MDLVRVPAEALDQLARPSDRTSRTSTVSAWRRGYDCRVLGGTASIRRAFVALTACVLVALASAVPAADASLRTVPVGNFDHPTYVENAPGYPDLLFVVERSGVVQVLDHGDRTGTPFLDADDIVRGPPDADGGDEEGMFSIAFAPDYRQSRLFYVCLRQSRWERGGRRVQAVDVDATAGGREHPPAGDRDHAPGQPLPRRRTASVRPRRLPVPGHRGRRHRRCPGAGPREPPGEDHPHRPAPIGGQPVHDPELQSVRRRRRARRDLLLRHARAVALFL